LNREVKNLFFFRDDELRKLSKFSVDFAKNEMIMENENNRISSLKSLNKELEVFSAYQKFLDPKTGISNLLLKNSIDYIERMTNYSLNKCHANFKVLIDNELIMKIFDNEKIDKKNHVSVNLGSSYQKFILGMILKKVL
jgi:hypothetical protein